MATNQIAGGGDPLPGTQNVSGTPKDTILDNSKGELSDGSTLEDLGYPTQGLLGAEEDEGGA